MTARAFIIAALAFAAVMQAGHAGAASLSVSGSSFLLEPGDGRRLTSHDLVGAVFQATLAGGAHGEVRIEAVADDRDHPGVLLHTLSFRNSPHEAWSPMCDADSQGRAAGFPIAGSVDANGHFLPDRKRWFLTCTSGAEGKCVLWGYDPWSHGPDGRSLVPYYEACIRAARADYTGKGAPFTRKGTAIIVYDAVGVHPYAPDMDATYPFEAGWSPEGAVCVAHTRWSSLLPLDVLLLSDPRLKAAHCDREEAVRRGAILFDNSEPHP